MRCSIRRLNRLLRSVSGQALTEYILALALVAVALAAALGLWKTPLAHYLNRLAHAIAQTR